MRNTGRHFTHSEEALISFVSFFYLPDFGHIFDGKDFFPFETIRTVSLFSIENDRVQF